MKVIATDLTDAAVELYSHKVNMIFFLLLCVFKVKSRNNQPENVPEPLCSVTLVSYYFSKLRYVDKTVRTHYICIKSCIQPHSLPLRTVLKACITCVMYQYLCPFSVVSWFLLCFLVVSFFLAS